jgi:hypothetical protein
MRFPRRRDPRDFDPFAREEDSFDSPSPRLFDIVEKRERKKTHTQNVSGRKENSSWIILATRSILATLGSVQRRIDIPL